MVEPLAWFHAQRPSAHTTVATPDTRCLLSHSFSPPPRLRALADSQEDVDVKMRLRRLFRSLQGVDDEVMRYNAMLAKFLDAKEDEWEAIVAVYRGDLQKPFFEHMQVGGRTGYWCVLRWSGMC